MTDEPTYPCPACGFLVFGEPPGSYAICDVCGWEDDHVQLANPTMAGGANHESLREAQQESLRHWPLDVREAEGCVRDPEWRPLTDDDLPVASPPRGGQGYFEAAVAEAPPYYWRARRP